MAFHSVQIASEPPPIRAVRFRKRYSGADTANRLSGSGLRAQPTATPQLRPHMSEDLYQPTPIYSRAKSPHSLTFCHKSKEQSVTDLNLHRR